MSVTRSQSASLTLSQDLKDYLERLLTPLAKSDDIQNLLKRLEDQETKIVELQKENVSNNKRIEVLESTLALKQHHMDILMEKCDDVEQCTRRHSVRINGIVANKKYDANEDVYKIIEECYNGIAVQFHRNEINRAHRVGKAKIDPKSKRHTQAIIVQFRNWDARCKFYQNRPKFHKEKPGEEAVVRKFTVALDLTKRRLRPS